MSTNDEIPYIQGHYGVVWYASFDKQGLAKTPIDVIRQIDPKVMSESILKDVLANPIRISIKNAGRLVHGLVSVYAAQVKDLYEASFGLLHAQATYNAILRQSELSDSHIKQKRQ